MTFSATGTSKVGLTVYRVNGENPAEGFIFALGGTQVLIAEHDAARLARYISEQDRYIPE